jgi:hypothetical protein
MIARAFGSSAVAVPAAAAAGGALRPAARRVPQVGLVQSAGVDCTSWMQRGRA